jgi:prolactin regulatory element-binding protein
VISFCELFLFSSEWQLYAVLVGIILLSMVVFYIFFELSDSFWNFPLGRNQPAKPFDSVLFKSQHDFGEDEL